MEYLKTIGGKNGHSRVREIYNRVFSLGFASTVSLKGQKGKTKLHDYKSIYDIIEGNNLYKMLINGSIYV